MNLEKLPAGFCTITQAEAEERFGLKEIDTVGKFNYPLIFLHAGDLHMPGDFDEAWVTENLFADEPPTREQELIVVDGSLSVDGMISIGHGRTWPSLLVRGDLRCSIWDMGENLVHIAGDVHVERLFHEHGEGHNGWLGVGGAASMPMLLVHDSPVWFKSLDPGTITLNYFSDEDEYYDFDYGQSDMYEICDPMLLKDGRDLEDEVDAYNFGVDFLRRVAEGDSPFKPGFELRKKND